MVRLRTGLGHVFGMFQNVVIVLFSRLSNDLPVAILDSEITQHNGIKNHCLVGKPLKF